MTRRRPSRTRRYEREPTNHRQQHHRQLPPQSGRTTPPNPRRNSSPARNPKAPNDRRQPKTRPPNTAANTPHLCDSSPRCISRSPARRIWLRTRNTIKRMVYSCQGTTVFWFFRSLSGWPQARLA
jgi:hypothetical protein